MIFMTFIRTKIVCTIGPAVATYEKMLALMEAGMNVARLNFSHGTFEEHRRNIANLKRAREHLKRPMAIMIDIKGPEIRVGKVHGDALVVKPQQRFKLVPFSASSPAPDEIPMRPTEAFQSLSPGMKILFDDGNIISTVVEAHGESAVIEIQNAGILKSGKGINMPGAHLNLPAVTQKDIADLKFGCEEDVDLVAASFIRSSHHVLSYKEFLANVGKPDILVIAKIENSHGVENFDQIVQVADGIMIARGDLGVEVDLAQVPKLQKMMIRKCYQACKSSITATQMLESMIVNPRPTRAEVSDVANAIYDSTSAIMLSGESAIGNYPIETVLRMKSIAQEAEADFPFRVFFEQHSQRDYHDLSSAVGMAAVKTAYSANAKAIFAFTTSGMTARLVSRLRPEMPIIAVTPNEKVFHQLASNWGVFPIHCPGCKSAKEAFAAASAFALEHQLISFGDIVIVTAGVPFGKKGTTNMMTVQSIGEVLVRGHKGFGPKVTGKVSIVLAPEALDPESLEGRLVVIPHCDNSFLPALKHAAGVILQNYIGDTASEKYAALVAKTFEISVMTRADGAMSLLQEGEEITLDPQKGLVYRGSEETPACPVFSM
jgi:pyruvate kinase